MVIDFLMSEYAPEFLEQELEESCLAQQEVKFFEGPRREATISPSDVTRNLRPPLDATIGPRKITNLLRHLISPRVVHIDVDAPVVNEYVQAREKGGLQVDGDMVFSTEASVEETFKIIRHYVDQANERAQAPVFFKIWAEATDVMQSQMQQLASDHLICWENDVMEGKVSLDASASLKDSFYFVVVPEPTGPGGLKNASKTLTEKQREVFRRYLGGSSSL